MSLFFRVIEHLLPSARAWRLSAEKCLKKFFEGFTGLGDDSKLFIDQVWEDIDPQLTRQLDLWDRQFGLPSSGLTEQERRDRLEARWKAKGGQDPRYIQDTLQAAGFDVYVHEWWDPDQLFHPGYGICCGATLAIAGNTNAVSGGGRVEDVIRAPVPRVPRTYLRDAETLDGFLISCGALGAVCRARVIKTPNTTVCGNANAICGNVNAIAGLTEYEWPSPAGSRIAPDGYVLVNILTEATSGVICAGNIAAICGGLSAISGTSLRGEVQKEYTIPDGSQYSPYFLYIGGENFPDIANVPANRKIEFETLCLQICPTQQWLGILVNYV